MGARAVLATAFSRGCRFFGWLRFFRWDDDKIGDFGGFGAAPGSGMACVVMHRC